MLAGCRIRVALADALLHANHHWPPSAPSTQVKAWTIRRSSHPWNTPLASNTDAHSRIRTNSDPNRRTFVTNRTGHFSATPIIRSR